MGWRSLDYCSICQIGRHQYDWTRGCFKSSGQEGLEGWKLKWTSHLGRAQQNHCDSFVSVLGAVCEGGEHSFEEEIDQE
uniref:50S ribosomal protein L6 n=1 Tax=Arundo donax TaxID=35708 RepID=A0A0A9GR07_ARUDO